MKDGRSVGSDDPTAEDRARMPSPLPEPGAPSTLVLFDPEGKLGPGVRLRDLEDEAALPDLRLGPKKYLVLGLLGEGGMGKVYLAFDRDLRRRVALKVVKGTSAGALARFLEEAQVMAQLEHPAIVPVHEVGLLDGLRLYYAMQVVRGQTLREVLAELRRGQAELVRDWPLVRRIQVLLQVTQAVAFAHEKGVVHRDLKPANVMIGRHGEVQVLDWGLSKVIEAGGVDTAPTPSRSGLVVGTPWYMSPEQAAGEPVDARSDVWSLGVMLYELLTLERPFEGTSSAVLAAIGRDRPQAPRERSASVPRELEEACLQALGKRREERTRSAAELVAVLRGWLEAEADRVQRHQRAEERVAEGRAKMAEYLRLAEEAKGLEAAAEARAAEIASWRPLAERLTVHAARAGAEEARRRLVRKSAELVRTLEKALENEENHPGARGLLADYYWGRLQETEARANPEGAAFFAERVASFHDGRYARELSGTGTLALGSIPGDAEVWLYEEVEEGPVLVPRRERRLGRTPLGPVELPMGSYLAVVRAEGYREARYPVLLGRNRAWTGIVTLYTDAAVGPGMVHIPAGPFLRGGDPELRGWCLPGGEAWLGDFFIAEQPVTMAEYLEFLAELAQTEGLEAATRRAPRAASQAPTYLVRRPDGGLTLPDTDAEGDRWDARWPVLGISWYDAVAYCAWRSRREGRALRLPTESEWEKAARGVDGRWYPWGWRFDAALCNMRDSRRERASPVAVGEFPQDVSVYGVRGMGANVRCWTATEVVHGEGSRARDARVVRGGGWSGGQSEPRCASQGLFDASDADLNIGFRLVADPRR